MCTSYRGELTIRSWELKSKERGEGDSHFEMKTPSVLQKESIAG